MTQRTNSILPLVALLLALAGCAPSTTSPLAPALSGDGSSYLLGPELALALPAAGFEESAATARDHELADRAVNGRVPAAGSPDENPCLRWNALTRKLAAAASPPPPLFARAYALVSIASHDALAAGQGEGRAKAPAGCLIGGAASEVLLDLFPSAGPTVEQELAHEAELAAAEGHGAIVRGLALGRVAGRVAVRHAHRDGSDAPFTGTIPVGDGLWTGTNPVLPMCGTWATWVLTSGTEFQPEPPYRFGSPEDLADVQAVIDAAAARTPESVAIVHKWADVSPPAIWNDLLNERIAARDLSPEAAAHAQAFLNMALYDAFVSCWATKYAYWVERPVHRIPGLVTVIPTPNFPAYTSGHSTISAAAATVLAGTFPDEAAFFLDQAREAAQSRLVAGIHSPHHTAQGLAVGARIGAKVVARLRAEDVGRARLVVLATRE